MSRPMAGARNVQQWTYGIAAVTAYQLFQTPDAIARRMVELAHPAAAHSIFNQYHVLHTERSTHTTNNSCRRRRAVRIR